MADIQLKLNKKLFSPKFYKYLFDYSHRFEVYYGGAGSGKSYFICQKLIIRCINEPIRVLVCRRYASTLRNSCFALFKEVLASWKLTQYVKINESDFRITFPNGSQILMSGLDSEEKLLSLADISTIWIEETFELETVEKLDQLNLRMRGKAANQQLILSFNPISKRHWLYNWCVENPPHSFIFIKSTYLDNHFLSQEYIKELEEMKTRNPRKAEIYVYGNFGTDPDGLVFTNWRAEEFDPMELAANGLEHRWGMDLGYRDPTAITEVLYDKDNHKIYICQSFYKSGCQLSTIVKAANDMDVGKSKIYCDAAEPRSIAFFRGEGLNAFPCIKGKDSVANGIAFLQDNEIIVRPQCEAVINELSNFCYIKSKQTGEYTEDVDHTYSHSIDSIRYSLSDIYQNKKLKTMSKSALGL